MKIWAQKVPGRAEAVGAREGPDQMAQGCEDVKGEFGFYSERREKSLEAEWIKLLKIFSYSRTQTAPGTVREGGSARPGQTLPLEETCPCRPPPAPPSCSVFMNYTACMR